MSALLLDPSPAPALDSGALATCPALPGPSVRAVSDGRPPSTSWSPSSAPNQDQPRLVFEPTASVEVEAPRPAGHRLHAVDPGWPSRRSPPLPDARSWSASLALALAEALQGRRPVGQLSRWVDEQVLASLTVAVRSDHRRAARAVRPAVLRSVRVQFPGPEAVEVAAHVHVDGRSRALAFRLEGWYDRWLCTALELGPR